MARFATDSTGSEARLAARRIADRLDAGTRRAAEAAARKAGMTLEDWLLVAIRRGTRREAGGRTPARGQSGAGRARAALLRGMSRYDAGLRRRLERRPAEMPVAGRLRADAAAEAARISEFVRDNPELFRLPDNVASRPLSRRAIALATLPVLALGLALTWQSVRIDLRWVGWIVAFLSAPAGPAPQDGPAPRQVSLTLDLERMDPAAGPAEADE